MAKIAERYLKVDPWEIIEDGFHPTRSRVSESIFSLANEYMGVRGYFEEGYSGDTLLGSYMNGVYEIKDIEHPAYFNGFSNRFCFMINTVDWLYTRISIDGEQLDINKCEILEFKRVLNMKNGTLTRDITWKTTEGKILNIKFIRFVSMVNSNLGCQRIITEPINFSGKIHVETGIDFSPIHELEKKNYWTCTNKSSENNIISIAAKTPRSDQQLFSSFKLFNIPMEGTTVIEKEKYIGLSFIIEAKEGQSFNFDKIVVNHVERTANITPKNVWDEGISLWTKYHSTSFETAHKEHSDYWKDVWNKLDIIIEGDEENQQGVRFCIFNLHQTYHGQDSTLNVGAKGLTGEYYFGWTWWDTETYCLPFYLFNNPKAAKSLVEYRYNTLPQAIERSKEMDCEGACYPMGTIDGTESCFVWQHGNLEIHVSAAIPYGIWHYMKICNDKPFLYEKGMEILLNASRYFASRGQWSPKGDFGFYGVMGADEFHMMVHNNCYTNLMAKKTFEYTLEVLEEMKLECPVTLTQVFEKVKIRPDEVNNWSNIAKNIRIPFDKETGIYEQHDGYFDLPHIDVKSIPHTDFPVYKNWAYDRIFRTDMTKQPDVLLFQYFFSQEYSLESKRANYEYYEPRCSHESSLSPAIHSIMASEIGKHEEAYEFARYASRIDLDDYNRNTHEGLHVTSMAATWMNIVYGFGGMRSDGDVLIFNPSIPKTWDAFSFRILHKGSTISISIDKDTVNIKVVEGDNIEAKIYGTKFTITSDGIRCSLRM